jgi:hypothetical protein
MSGHQIQFQHGMSIPEFLARFGTEEPCAEAIRRTRWPGGLIATLIVDVAKTRPIPEKRVSGGHSEAGF